MDGGLTTARLKTAATIARVSDVFIVTLVEMNTV